MPTTRQEHMKILTSLTIVQAELDMTAGVLYELGYTNLARDLDEAGMIVHSSRITVISNKRRETQNGKLEQPDNT